MKKSNERLRHQLEVQSIQIEEFLTRHDVSAEVEGGTVRSRWVNFDLNTQISAGLDKLRHLGSELASTLGASDVSISQMDDRLRIAVKQPKTHPVDLLDLMEALADFTPMTATLGLDVADRPVLLNLLADDIVNILVAGGPDAGKTALLRSFALSLALQNKQSQVQMAVIDVVSDTRTGRDKATLYPLNYLPHVMFNVVENYREAAEALEFLVSEASYRVEQEVTSPLLIVIIDNADYLVEVGGRPIKDSLTYLLEEGEIAGMRIVLGAANPDSDMLRPLIKHTMPVRLVGQVADATRARAVTGIQDSQAEYLMGQGDFIAVSNGMILPFQAAYINDYDLHLILDKLHRQSQPVMLAQPMMIRPTTADYDDEPDEPQSFAFNSQDRRASLSSEPNGTSPSRIEEPKQSYISRWNSPPEEVEAEDWEEIEDEDDEDEWLDENLESEKKAVVIDVWADVKKRPHEADDDDDDDDDWQPMKRQKDTSVEVWARPEKEQKNNKLSTSFSDEIEFEWE